MLELVTTTQFRKDLKRLRKRGADMKKLDDILQTLCAEEPLSEKIAITRLSVITSGFVNAMSLPIGCSSMPSTKANLS